MPGQLAYVRTDLNYPCECAICTDRMTRRIETQEFIDDMLRAFESFELCTAYSCAGLLFLDELPHVSLKTLFSFVSMTDSTVLSRPYRVHTGSNSSASETILLNSDPDLSIFVPKRSISLR